MKLKFEVSNWMSLSIVWNFQLIFIFTNQKSEHCAILSVNSKSYIIELISGSWTESVYKCANNKVSKQTLKKKNDKHNLRKSVEKRIRYLSSYPKGLFRHPLREETHENICM